MSYEKELKIVHRGTYWEMFFADTGSSTGICLTRVDHFIGLGKIDPTEKLDVEGNIRFSGALMPDNDPGIKGALLLSDATNFNKWLSPGTDGMYIAAPETPGDDPVYQTIPASDVVNTPAGNIEAIDVQAAINELDTEKLNLDQTIPQIVTGGAPIFDDGIGVALDKAGTTPQQLFDISGNMNITQVVQPVNTFTLTETTGGALDDGAVYLYSIAYITANGDTSCSGDTGSGTLGKSITLAAGKNAVIIGGLPISVDPRVTGRRIYRSIGGGSAATGGSILINNNTATSYTDLIADESLSTVFGTMYRKDNLSIKGIYVNNVLMAKLGNWNTSCGYDALQHITTGYENFAFGRAALHSVTAGNKNIGIGSSAGIAINTGSGNVGIGYAAINSNQAGSSNIGIGENAIRLTSLGDVTGNTGVGHQSFYGIISGNNYNTGLGYGAGNNFRGLYNIFIGANTGFLAAAIAIGNYNLFMGYGVGDNAIAGADNNILIGNQLDLQAPAGDNQLSIGNLIFGTGINGTGTTISTGNVGICIALPTARLHLPASAAAANLASLKIDAGVLATTPVSGNIESDGTHLYWTDSGGTRRQLDS